MKIKNRVGAFFFHLILSALILIAALSVVLLVWYPNGLIYAGGLTGLKILLGVDLVLGPVLTLIVYSPGKKGLLFDLAVIGFVQIVCLVIGLSLIFNQRPMVQILLDDGVHLLSATDQKEYKIKLDDIPGRHPKRVMMDLPADKSSWASIKYATEFVEEKPFAARFDLYVPLKEVSQDAYNERVAIILDQVDRSDIDKINGSKARTCTWIPIYSVHTTGYACFSYERGIERLSKRSWWAY